MLQLRISRSFRQKMLKQNSKLNNLIKKNQKKSSLYTLKK